MLQRCQQPSRGTARLRAADAALKKQTMLVAQPTPDAAHWRPHCTSVIPHPLFPHGAKHFLHPCEHLRPGVDVVIPGLMLL